MSGKMSVSIWVTSRLTSVGVPGSVPAVIVIEGELPVIRILQLNHWRKPVTPGDCKSRMFAVQSTVVNVTFEVNRVELPKHAYDSQYALPILACATGLLVSPGRNRVLFVTLHPRELFVDRTALEPQKLVLVAVVELKKSVRRADPLFNCGLKKAILYVTQSSPMAPPLAGIPVVANWKLA